MRSSDSIGRTGAAAAVTGAFAILLLAGCGQAIEQTMPAATPAPPVDEIPAVQPMPPIDPAQPDDPVPPVDPAHPVEPPPRPVQPVPVPDEPALAPVITLSTRVGVPGTELKLEAHRFTPNVPISIGFGAPGAEPREIQTFTPDADGTVRGTVRVPDWAATGEAYVFVASGPAGAPIVLSDRFHIQIRDDGTIRVAGRLTDEGVECPALRTEDGALYTLTGDLAGARAGDRVVVEGTLPDMSTCMQGTTIAVARIERSID